MMFLLELTYQKPIEEVDRFLVAHRDYLETHFQKGNLICSGPQNPRTGGIIFTRFKSKEEVAAFAQQDPFFLNGIATHRIIEFNPVKFDPGFKNYIS